jgi:hypothetical protein
MSVKQLSNGKRMGGVCTLTLALNTESVATFITTCFLKKANKTNLARAGGGKVLSNQPN